MTGLTTALSVPQGGTGATTLTSNNVILGNGSSAVQFVAPGTSGNVLTSNGTTWSSSAPAPSAGVSSFSAGSTGFTPSTATTGAVTLSGTLAVGNGGTGVATITTGGLVVGAATSAVTSLNPATAGNSIIDSGTAWTSVAKNWSYRNLLINGEGKVAQRGNLTAPTTSYTADQWEWKRATATGDINFTANDATVLGAGFPTCMKFAINTVDTSIAATDLYQIRQNIEGYRVSRVGLGTANAKSLAYQFLIQVDSTDLSFPATFTGFFQNSAQDRTYPFTFTVTASGTPQKITGTITGDTSGTWLTTTGVGLRWGINVAAGSNFHGTAGAWAADAKQATSAQCNWMNHANNILRITGLQVEVGSVATPFEYRDYGEELRLCHRFLFRWTLDQTANQRVSYQGGNRTMTTTTANVVLSFPQMMRGAPTMSSTSADTFNWNDGAGANRNCSAISFAGTTITETEVSLTHAAGTVGGGSLQRDASDTTNITASAEM